MSTDTHHSPDLYKGDDRGRIYRISPESRLPRAGKIRLGEASDEDLVNLLASPNIWYRRTAQRLLVDRGHVEAVIPLEKLFATSPSAVARLHALWTLEGLGQLDPRLLKQALDDPEAGVRENAILLAEPRLGSHPELVEKLLAGQRDPDGRVQFQLLCTLGGVNTAPSRAAQDRVLAQHIEDPWMQIAALSASSDRAPQLFASAGAFTDKRTDARVTFFYQVSAVIGARRRTAEIRQLLSTLIGASTADSSWWRAASLDGLAQGLRGSGEPRRFGSADAYRPNLGEDLVLKLFASPDADVRRASLRVVAATGLPQNAIVLLRSAAAIAQTGDEDSALRADSIGLLTLADPAAHEALFRKLIDPQQPEPIQAAAVRALGRVKGARIGAFLIERWKSMTGPVRTEAADAMFLDPERPKLLLEAIRTDVVPPWTLAFRHKRQLLMNPDARLREAARSLLGEKAGEREGVLKRYEAALDKTGDPERGRVVFERVCAKCHKLNGLGYDVGPDLATIRNRPAQLILPDIIMPNRSIAQNYESYVVERKSGGIVEGILGSQTPTTVTIRHEGGVDDVIRRDDVKELRVTKLSAMPADLDKQITVDQMADLLAFLKQ
jgi:putative heme-binding domain-containing protein